MNYTRPKTFVIHKNDAGTDAYCDLYVHALEAEIERLKADNHRLQTILKGSEEDYSYLFADEEDDSV